MGVFMKLLHGIIFTQALLRFYCCPLNFCQKTDSAGFLKQIFNVSIRIITPQVVVKRQMNSVISPVVEKSNMAVETSTNRAHSGKKKRGKVPKRISKAEREKTKREHFNKLFLDLANALELSEQNSGKATVLDEAIHMVKNMLDQVDCLGKENAALLSESQYSSVIHWENAQGKHGENELQDENSALEAQIGELQFELKERVSGSQLDLNLSPPEYEIQELASHISDGHHRRLPCMEPVVNPLYLFPVCSNTRAYQEPAMAELAGKPTAVVSKPHPRYPTAADTWPSGFLKINGS
ncbi:transcription factor bHLH [Forsythia ovata]|uniref:Transcription factor bHLH n=1 Tax=Forsythia ovata TaxID=205694 RepID=A0ABD1PGU9_9LAMI